MPSTTMLQILFGALIILTGFAVYYLIHIGNQHVPASKKIQFNRGKIVRTMGWLLGLAVIVLILSRHPVLRSVLVAILFAAITAYILNPLVQFLEKKGIRRTIAILLIYLAAVAILTLLFVLVLPRTIEETTKFVSTLPGLITQGMNSLMEFLDRTIGDVVSLENLRESINFQIAESMGALQAGALRFAGSVTQYVGSLFTRMVGLVLFPIITFYFLQDKEKFLAAISQRVPENRREPLRVMMMDIDVSLSQFVRGRLLMSLFVGVCTMIYLMFFGIDFALVIGIITAIADIIPYIGPFLGFLPAVLLALMKGPATAVQVAVLFVLIQWAENNLVGPKLLGDSTGLHPFIVLLSLIVGGALFGVIGMIFSVPVVAAIVIVWKHFVRDRMDREF